MAALKVAILLTLAAVSHSQFGAFRGFNPAGAPFGQAGFGVGRSPVGFQALAQGPFVGYEPFFSGLQRTQIYSSNLGYDQSSAAGPNCYNGVRMPNGLCQCNPGFKGADCNVPFADVSLNQEAGFVCLQTPGSPQETAQQVTKYQNLGPLGQLQFTMKKLMQYGGQAPGNIEALPPMAGPGIGAFCPLVPNGAAMAPVTKKSALTDYGFIMCSENQMCYNMECPACTMYNAKTGGCDNIPNAAARGLPNCNVGGGPAPEGLKVQWYQAALNRPKLSAEPNAPVAPGGAAPVGNAFLGNSPAPYARPFYA